MIRAILLWTTAMMLMVGASGCGSDGADDDSSSSNGYTFEPVEDPHEGPPFTFEVDVEESATNLAWSVEVPSGGWSLSFDRAQSNRITGAIDVYVTLTAPGPEETVTQALETHEGDYRHGRTAFDRAQLLVRMIERGEDPERVEHRRAATWAR